MESLEHATTLWLVGHKVVFGNGAQTNVADEPDARPALDRLMHKHVVRLQISVQHVHGMHVLKACAE